MNSLCWSRRLGATVVLFLPVSLFAQWSSLPAIDNDIIVDSSIVPIEVSVCADGAGGAVWVWGDGRSGDKTKPGDFLDIYVQRLDANGTRLWGDNGTPVAVNPGGTHMPRIIRDGADGFFVTWYDTREEGGTFPKRIYLQHLDADGQPLWATNGILVRDNALVAAEPRSINLCTDGAGGVYVVTNAGQGDTARVHRFTGDGTVAAGWPADGLSPNAPGSQEAFLVVSDQPDDFVGEHGLVLVNLGRNVRHILSDGTLGYLYALETNSGNLAIDAACSDGAGGMFVAQHSSQIVLTHVQADGTIAWPAWPDAQSVIADGGGVKSHLNVVGDGGGGAIVTWFEYANGLFTGRAQRVTSGGDRLWGPTGRDAVPPVDAFGGSSVGDGVGGVIIAWRQDVSPIGWHAQRLNGAGDSLWGPDGVVVSTAGSITQLVSDSASGAIYTIEGGTISNRHFAAKRTTLTGVLGSNSPLARLVNISARAQVGSGDSVIIPGFVIGGSGTSQLLIRGIGPTLANYSVTGALSDTALTVYDSANQIIATNDDWGTAANATAIAAATSQVSAFALDPDAHDAAVLVTLGPGLYTAVLGSAIDGESGVGLVELYEVGDGTGGTRLVNLSTRALVGTGENILIPGLVVGGSQARTLLIRAIGPKLADYGVVGVLDDPQLTLFNDAGVAVGANDNWSSPNGAQISSLGDSVGAFPLPANSKDAAILVTLGTGQYTVQVSGVGDTTGICLVEVYEVP